MVSTKVQTSTTVTSTLTIAPTITYTTVTSSAMVVPSVVPSSRDVVSRRSEGALTRSKSATVMTVRVSPGKTISPPKSPIVVYKSPSNSPTPTNSPQQFQYPSIDNNTLYQMICERDVRMQAMEVKMNYIESLLHVKDSVIGGLKGEIERLQQFTRRYCVSITGIPKPRGEKSSDLKPIVENLVTEVGRTSIEDIDKFHRNGPQKGSEQEIILRFKSHSAKEAFYKGRKNLGQNRVDVKIRPSLSSTQLNLLNDARNYLDSQKGAILPNPPEFIFANMHGIIQVKMKNKCIDGLFISINSVDHLARIIARANIGTPNETFKLFEKDSGWADASDDDMVTRSDDEMGFGLFD